MSESILPYLPQLIAHRGASAVAPENTLSALHKARELGADWVEFDVQLTSDDRAIVFHDSELERVTNGQGTVAKLTYSKLAQLDAGSWFDAAYKGECIPTVGMWLQLAAELGLGINLEMKITKQRRAAKLAEKVLFGIAQFWQDDLPRPLISSTSEKCLAAVRKRDAHINLGYICDTWRDAMFTILERHHCVSLHINHERLNPERIADIKNRGYRVLAYTVNDKQRANELLSMGVDSIFSDKPNLLQE